MRSLLGFMTCCAHLFPSDTMFTLTDSTSDLIDPAVLYMQIVFAGILIMMAHDFGTGILCTVAGKHQPMLYLLPAASTSG